MDQLVASIAKKGNGRGGLSKSARRAVAIVGSHPKTRELAPYDDPRFEIWLFNEAAQKPEVYRRWDALLQIHLPEVYRSEMNFTNKDHWRWLQEKHGKPIYMQKVDPDVPDSVEYPLEGILAMTPYHYLRSSPAMALALAIYQGYQEIWLYGSELSSNTEYSYQAINYGFWIGFAHGLGIDLRLECWHDEFNQLIYGYEGELQIGQDFFITRLAEHEKAWKHSEGELSKLKGRLDSAMLENDYAKVGDLSVDVEDAAQAAGEAYARMSEAKRYSEKTGLISRTEFEKKAAQAQQDGDASRTKKYFTAGKCEYLWNAWMQSGDHRPLIQLRIHLEEKNKQSYETGVQFGTFKENMEYMYEYDARLQAAGGIRALGNPKEYAGPRR